MTFVLVVYRKQLLISPELIYLCKVFWRASIRGGLYPRGLISQGAYIRGGSFNRNKKCTSKRAVIVLIKIRLAFTGL